MTLYNVKKYFGRFYFWGVLIPLLQAILIFSSFRTAEKLKTDIGTINFVSNAPLEVIKAESKKLRGILETGSKNFAFAVTMNTFYGFNSPLQRVHFNENYLETDDYPEATFSGKIIENIDFSVEGVYNVRAKGVLYIHGVKSDKTIKGTLKVSANKIEIEAAFTVLLNEFNITIPKVVQEKISPEIEVKMSCIFNR